MKKRKYCCIIGIVLLLGVAVTWTLKSPLTNKEKTFIELIQTQVVENANKEALIIITDKLGRRHMVQVDSLESQIMHSLRSGQAATREDAEEMLKEGIEEFLTDVLTDDNVESVEILLQNQ